MIPLVGFPCGTGYKYKHYQAASCNLTVVPFALLHRFKPTHQQESSSYRAIINPCFLALLLFCRIQAAFPPGSVPQLDQSGSHPSSITPESALFYLVRPVEQFDSSDKVLLRVRNVRSHDYATNGLIALTMIDTWKIDMVNHINRIGTTMPFLRV